MLSAATRQGLNNITREQCEEFRNNPSTNPITRRRINPEGSVAAALREICNHRHPVQPRRQARNAFLVFEGVSLTRNQAAIDVYTIGTFMRNPRNNQSITLSISPQPLAIQRNEQHAQLFYNYQSQLRETLGERVYDIVYQAGMDGIRMPRLANVDRMIASPPGRVNGVVPRRPELTHEELDELRPFLDEEEQQRLVHQINLWNMRSRSPNVQKKQFSSPETINYDEISQQCGILFTNVSLYFSKFANKLRKMCNDYTQECGVQQLSTIRQELVNMNTKTEMAPILEVPNKVAEEHRILPSIFSRIMSSNIRIVRERIFRVNIRDIRVNFGNAQGVGIGNTLSFLQLVADEISKSDLFVPAEVGSSRYIINPNLTLQMLQDKGFKINDTTDITKLFTLVGEFIALCVRNGVPINISLSRAILAHLLYKPTEIDPDEYTFYYIMDMPQTSRPEISLLSQADDIEMIGSEMNDVLPLVPSSKNVPITKENYRMYLSLMAKQRLTQRNDMNKPDTSAWLQAFVDGFYIRNKMRTLNTTVSQLDKLIGGIPIAEAKFLEWMTTGPLDTNQARTPYQQELAVWLREIMMDMGRTFPFNEIGIDPQHLTLDERKEVFMSFIGRLMFFWTGVRRLDFEKKHQVLFLAQGGLPLSSTCFYQLKLPNDVTTKPELYRRLVVAVYNVEAVVGNYGGAKRKLKRTHKR